MPGDGERPVVLGRDEVKSAAHEERLYDSPPLERSGQALALEAVDARQEREVRRGRVLRLQAGEPPGGAAWCFAGRTCSSASRSEVGDSSRPGLESRSVALVHDLHHVAFLTADL